LIPIETQLMREFLDSVSSPTPMPKRGLCRWVYERADEFKVWTHNLDEAPDSVQALHNSIGFQTDHAQTEISDFIKSNNTSVVVLYDMYWGPGRFLYKSDDDPNTIYNRTGRYKFLREDGINDEALTSLLNRICSDRFILAFFDQDCFPLEALQAGNIEEIVNKSSSVAVLAFDGEGMIFGQKK
jgi:hypothetical protein